MRGAFAPRFAIEVAFLILLAAGAGYADLRPAVIIGLLAGGWVLVSLIELAVWRSQARPASSVYVALESAEDEPELELEPEPEEAPAPDDDEYPLRPDAGDARSEEVEEYTRILSASSAEERSPAQPGG